MFSDTKKSKGIESHELLPFQDQIDDSKNSISDKTVKVLIKLIRNKKLPSRVVSFAKQIKEINKEFPYE